mgnify:CR=1 FL=1
MIEEKKKYVIRHAYYSGLVMENPKMHLLIEKDLKSQLEEDAQLQAMYLAMVFQSQRYSSLPFYIALFIQVLMILSVIYIRFFR